MSRKSHIALARYSAVFGTGRSTYIVFRVSDLHVFSTVFEKGVRNCCPCFGCEKGRTVRSYAGQARLWEEVLMTGQFAMYLLADGVISCRSVLEEQSVGCRQL
jgi:hypothetical protein